MSIRTRLDRSRSSPSRGAVVVVRLLLAVLFSAASALLIASGTWAIHTHSYEFAWSSGEAGGVEVLDGPAAVEHGVGLAATGVMLVVWSASLLWSIGGRIAPGREWSVTHSIWTLFSLAAGVAAVGGFFPPWRIGQRPSCNAFYLVMVVFALLATVRDANRLRQMGQFLFPAIILAGILVGQLWAGFFAGILAGIFGGLILATQILLLIPRAHVRLWKEDPAIGSDA